MSATTLQEKRKLSHLLYTLLDPILSIKASMRKRRGRFIETLLAQTICAYLSETFHPMPEDESSPWFSMFSTINRPSSLILSTSNTLRIKRINASLSWGGIF